MTMQDFRDSLANALFGMSFSEAKAKGICVECKEPALAKCYSEAGRKEFMISGMCEQCFDNLWRNR